MNLSAIDLAVATDDIAQASNPMETARRSSAGTLASILARRMA